MGKRLVQGLRRELGLAIPPRKPRRRRRGVSTGLPTKAEHPDHVWTWDFIHDKTVRGGSLKMLTVLDEYTRECRVIHVDRHINAETVRGIMQKLLEEAWTATIYSQRQRFRSEERSDDMRSHSLKGNCEPG